MKQLYAVLAVAATLIGPASSQTKNPFLGRWDLVVTSPRGTANQWMEIIEKDGKLDGRIQPGGGAVRPIVAAKMDGSHLIVTVAAAPTAPRQRQQESPARNGRRKRLPHQGAREVG